MKVLALVIGWSFMGQLFAQPPAASSTIYEYKKYEKFDLGNLEVKGELIAPGDISVRDRERRRFELDLYSRKNFDELIKKDVESLR